MEPEYEPDFSQMKTADLATYAHQMKIQAEVAEKRAERAIEELKERIQEEGTALYGDTAVVAFPTRRFSAKNAKATLTPAQYTAICKYKPDSKLAKKILGEKSKEYQNSCETYGWTLRIRDATDEDHEVALGKSVLSETCGVEDSVQDDEPPF
ncbi:hypothetical protein [Streptomyces sp. 5-10]|uniref:hypothetical protein n=1 Tax=Streptomyces sp. 5-10 TaxID=878925 RepID=UPI00168A852B|nr:hypothetical protein [Streptomyces sp. 5-10]MBD3004875.1 hypothetical protein [Streptomyces sp. 5-10]